MAWRVGSENLERSREMRKVLVMPVILEAAEMSLMTSWARGGRVCMGEFASVK